jgi:hypothetical protein
MEELARACDKPYQTVSGEIRRLQSGGLMATRVIGRSKLVRAEESSPYFAPLAQLVLMSFGPPLVVSEELAGLPGVEQTFTFGSWAARYDGQPGPAPHDVDVMLVGVPDRDAVDEAARRAQSRLLREVNVTLRSRHRAWTVPAPAQRRPVRDLLTPPGCSVGCGPPRGCERGEAAQRAGHASGAGGREPQQLDHGLQLLRNSRKSEAKATTSGSLLVATLSSGVGSVSARRARRWPTRPPDLPDPFRQGLSPAETGWDKPLPDITPVT